MLLTGYISLSLRKRTKALNLELTQRKKAETAISELSKQFQSVLDGIPHGVTLFNRAGECLWSNDNNNDLLNNPDFHYLDGQPFDLSSTLFEAINNNKSIIADMVIHKQYWQLQLHLIGNQQAVILLEETTEQQQLRQANDEASRLASLGELSAGIAHEINNPTGIIVHAIAFINDALADLSVAANHYQQQNPFWNIAGLAPTPAMDELKLSGQSIMDGAERISRIVSDLKRYALPTVSDEHQLISLNEVVQASLRLTANQIKNLKVVTQLQTPSPTIKGDEQQLNQVLINLIQNACHAIVLDETTYDDQHLSISTSIEQQFACLTVTDKGQGMDQATLQRITEPFFTTRRSSGGSGLGLSVCSRIIKEHQAKMQIKSRIGQGTTVIIRFPLESET
jgi:signal transduction histidine kinase